MDKPASTQGHTYSTGIRLFVCTLALSYIAAFGAYWLQADGLVGPSGILPANQFLEVARHQLGTRAYLDIPSVCWVVGAGASIKVLCAVGICLSIALLLGYAPAICLGLMWICYLSLVSVGQVFYDFQWDALLLESTLVAVFLVPWTLAGTRGAYEPPRLARYLAWWLLFRLMFLSGLAKLTSGDPTWRHLTALTFHFQTQPLPTPLAWYASKLPHWFQMASCGLMFAIELLAPLLILAPRRTRHWAVLSLIALQVAIALTGNYAFFNLLSLGLCLTCLDDGWWRDRHWGVADRDGNSDKGPWVKAPVLKWFAALSVGLTFFESVAATLPGGGSSVIVQYIAEAVGPFRSFNDYGLFAVMTVERPELIIEGSDNGKDWSEYELPFKPGALTKRPRWVAPYQPRLDWQLWFAALNQSENEPWVETLCAKLLKGDKAVLGLFSHNPFPDAPPHFMRVVRYEYAFTSADVRARTHEWWQRTPIDFYIPPVSLPDSAK